MDRYPDDNPKTQLGIKKVPLHLVPPVAVAQCALAFGDGAEKYGPYNWREKTVSSSIYVSAMKRHIDAWWDGEEMSRDAYVHHLGHAMACLAILLDAQSVGRLNDDRPAPGGMADLIAKEEAMNTPKETNVKRKVVGTNPLLNTEGQARENRMARGSLDAMATATAVETFGPLEPNTVYEYDGDLDHAKMNYQIWLQREHDAQTELNFDYKLPKEHL